MINAEFAFQLLQQKIIVEKLVGVLDQVGVISIVNTVLLDFVNLKTKRVKKIFYVLEGSADRLTCPDSNEEAGTH